MKKEKVPLLITIVILAGMLSPAFVHTGHAATGQVCLADPTTANPTSPCPSSPPVFSAPVGQQIRIGIFISGSDPMDGFDITLLTNQSFLVPAYVSTNTVDLTNTVLIGTPITVGLCVNGQLVTGTTCSLSDKPGTIHFAATSALGSPLTSTPTTGLLFTAIFNVTAISTGSQPIGFQSGAPGCVGTSVPGLCVTIANGTANPLAETAETSTFNNSRSATMPSVVLSANVTSFGPEFPGVSNHVNITATPINGYSINSTEPIQFSTIATTGLSANLSPSSCSTASVLCSSLLTLTASANGNYSVSVVGSYHTFDSLGNPDTVSSVVSAFVDVYDFGFTISPTSVTFVSGETAISTATLSSQNGFSGVVLLSTNVNLPSGLTIGYAPSQLALSSGQTLTSTITFKASPSAATTYHVKVNAAFGSRVKTSALLTVAATAPIPDFYFLAIPTTIGPVDAGVNATSTITVGFVNGFSSPVTLSISSPMGVLATLNQTSLTGTHNVTLTASSSVAGTHAIMVTGSGAAITHSITINLVVAATGFIISANPASIITSPHVTGTSTITVTPVGGFVGQVTLTTTNNANPLIGLVCSLSSSLINTAGTSNLACTSPSAGNFPITVIGTSGNIVQTLSVALIVTSSGDFALSASPSIVNASPGVLGTSTITVTPIGVFNDTVVLTSQAPPGLVCSLTRGVINVTGTSGLSCTGALGSYTVTVTGIGGSLVHSVSLIFNIKSAPGVGLVCIANQGNTSCPNAPPIIGSSATNPSQLRIAVVVDSSSGLSGFDITLLTNSTILKPAGVDLAGSVLMGQPIVLAECLSGSLIVGSTCSHTDTNGTLHLVATSALGAPLTAPSTTGLLFTAIYNVTGTTSGTTIGFQVGCSSVSVAGGVCVTIANGTPTPVVENIQTGVFTNLPTFLLQTPFSVGPIAISSGSSRSLLLNVTGLNGFSGVVTLAGKVSPSGPTVNILPASLRLNATIPFAFANSTVLIASSVLSGNYNLTITGTSGTLSRSLMFLVIVTGPDFTITLSAPTLTFDTGQSGHSTIIVSSLAGFSGTITLTTASSPSGLTLSSLPSLSLLSNGTNSSILVISAGNSTKAGTYAVTIAGVSGTISHHIILTVNIEDFQLVVTSGPVVILHPGNSGVSSIYVQSLNGFSGVVFLAPSRSPSINATLAIFGRPFQGNVSIGLGPNQSVQLLLETAASLTAQPGNYTVTITGTGPSSTHAAIIFVIVVVPPPDFTVTANPLFLTIVQGSHANSTITLQSIAGFHGNITLSYQLLVGSGITITLQPSSVLLAAGTSRAATIVISTSNETSPSTYSLIVTATNQTLSHSVQLSFQVLAPPDELPTASFTFTPRSPIVNQVVSFDGSNSSDSDGFVTLWIWNFGDGSGLYISSTPLIDHTFFNAGNYTVTLAVQDNSGQRGSTSETAAVLAQPAHDVSILQIFVSPTRAVSTQTVDIQVNIRDDGTSAENVTLTTYVGGRAISSLSGFIFPCGQNCFFFATIAWDTTGFLPGNYTISATLSLPAGEIDPTPQDNSFTDGIVTILPPPVIVSVPSSGIIGSEITIEGSGFPNPGLNVFGPQVGIIQVTFDDMNVGFILTSNGTFTFVMDVPEAQPGIHVIKAYDEVSGARTSTGFQVLPNPGNILVTVDTGAIYFPGDTATVYILTTLNGTRIGPNGVLLLLTLVYPNGSITNLKPTSVSPGLYDATYKIPSSRSLGTYSIIATAHLTGASDGSTLGGFEVKPTWLSSHNSQIAGGTAVAGVFGFAAVAWRRGYFRRKSDNDPRQREDLGRAKS